MPRPWSRFAFVGALALVAGACGGGTEYLTSNQVARLETAVHDLADEVYSPEVGVAKCPARIVREDGRVIACTITIGGATLVYRVTQTDGDGKTRLEPTASVHLTEKIRDLVAAYATDEGAPTSSVSCGEREVIVRKAGEYITCTVEFADGSTGTAILQARDTAGEIGLQSLTRN